ncbi:MAG TPA: hypothetical protein VHL79_03325 [Ramlibacter sp.]|nr:hypothetical protein [Ramlibacter sp.]
MLIRLGEIYFHGWRPLSRPDKARAIALYERAAQTGFTEAQVLLAAALEQTNGSPEAQLHWLEQAALRGDDRALKPVYASLFERVPADHLGPRRLQVLLRVANEGRIPDREYPMLAGTIGAVYEHGAGGNARNAQEAVRWYLRAADRGSHQHLWSALRIYKRGIGMPADHARAQQLLDRFFREQVEFFRKQPALHVEWLHQAAELGFSSAALRLADIYDKGTHGVKADPGVAARWRTYAQDARHLEETGVARVKAPPKRDLRDTQCEADARSLVQRELGKAQATYSYVAHYNRLLNKCLAHVTVMPKAPDGASAAERDAIARASTKVLVDVAERRELAQFVGNVPNAQHPLACRAPSIHLREPVQLRDHACSSLAEYEKLVAALMRE